MVKAEEETKKQRRVPAVESLTDAATDQTDRESKGERWSLGLGAGTLLGGRNKFRGADAEAE